MDETAVGSVVGGGLDVVLLWRGRMRHVGLVISIQECYEAGAVYSKNLSRDLLWLTLLMKSALLVELA